MVKIVSGGQTGVDRAALDVALELGMECGGWCPKGRRAEDGEIPSHYPLRESPDSAYSQRTRWNVRDSDATLILNQGALAGGTRMTRDIALELGRPVKVVDLDEPGALDDVRVWLTQPGPAVLNVAGPRESGRPGIQERAVDLLRRVFAVLDP